MRFLTGVVLIWIGICFCPFKACAEVDTGRQTGSTPYDQWLGPVRTAFARLPGKQPSIDEVRASLRTAFRFRYFFDPARPYVPQAPEVTEARRQGDCKAKSLWLATKMGDRKARYVVGKASTQSRLAHAWLLWPSGGIWIILDPTNTSEIIVAEQVAGKKLFPKYSYNAGGAYVHPSYSQYAKD